MRKMTYFVMALALVLGLTQCKKEQLDDLNDEGELVPITLTVGDNSRVIVNPTGADGYATVAFEDGDEILVGYNNAYVGKLTYSNRNFSGNVSISQIVEGEYLHFYFLGGKGFNSKVSGNKATVVISDQTARYPVISYAPSTREFDGAGSYSAKLMNKCSIMKFNVSTPSSAPMCITGMKNKVTVDFAKSNNNHDNGFSYGQDGNGVISMKAQDANNTVWAIVLPQGALAEGAEGSAYSMGYKGNRPAMDAIGSNQYIDANVTLTMSTFDVNYMPLTFEAKENNATVKFVARAGVTPIDMEYNKNGNGWVAYTNPDGISLNQGDKVSFRGKNNSLATSSTNTSKFTCSGPCYIYGNIMSLLDKIAYPTVTALETANTFRNLFVGNTNIYNHENYPLVLPATIMAQECYSYMFSGCTSLTSAPTLPATTLVERCYGNMFEGCTGLTSAPALPASTLSASCYQCMFQGCTNLSSAPELSATALALNCYSYMFSGCTSLSSAPELPAGQLAECCYQNMFYGCIGLTTAPALPASTLANYCYQRMFQNCSNLNSVTCLATNISATDCITNWLDGVASSGTFYKAASMTGWEEGINVPNGWTVQNAN